MLVPSIELTPDESRLVHLLTECADWVDQHPDQVDTLRLKDDQGQWIGKERGDDSVELRIAGGWVRDKVSSFNQVEAPDSGSAKANATVHPEAAGSGVIVLTDVQILC